VLTVGFEKCPVVFVEQEKRHSSLKIKLNARTKMTPKLIALTKSQQ
jgi:hypothetical protein